MAEPIIYNNKAIDRGLASSADFNALITDIFHDMNNLSLSISDNQSLLQQTVSMIRHENDSLLSRIATLEYKLENSKELLDSLKAGIETRSIRSLVSEPGAIISRNNFDTMDMYNVGTPSVVKTYEKLRATDTPNPELKVTVTEALSSAAYTPDIFSKPSFIYNHETTPELMCMFDGSYDLFFARTARSQDASDSDSLYAMIDITVPLNVVNNLRTNCMKINPIPKYSLDIMSIEYRDTISGDWKSLPNMINGDNTPKIIKNVPSVMITYPTIETTQIRIVIRQSRHTTTHAYDNTPVIEYFYGFQEISLQLLDVTAKESSFISKIELESNATYFNIVGKPELIVDNFQSKDIVCNFNLYQDFDGSGISHSLDFNTPIVANKSALYVETILNSSGTTIPVIKGIKVLCEVK